MRVVLDTNVIVSAIRFQGLPGAVWERCLFDKSITFVSSPEIIAEITRVFAVKFNMPSPLVHNISELVQSYAMIVYPKVSLHVVRDPKDDKFIEAAVESKTLYIISGDKDLLALKSHGKIKIITPAKFLQMVK